MLHPRMSIYQKTMTIWAAGLVVTMVAWFAVSGCDDQCLFCAAQDEGAVTVRLINDSAAQHVSPNLGVCPNGMAAQPHVFVDPLPVLGPGEEITYTTTGIAGSQGDCLRYTTDFMIGLCGWQYGASADDLVNGGRPYGGQIGFQFQCGDTVILRWLDDGEEGGEWTSEVETAPGNEPPAGEFQDQ